MIKVDGRLRRALVAGRGPERPGRLGRRARSASSSTTPSRATTRGSWSASSRATTPSTGASAPPRPGARRSSTAWSATSARRRPSPIDYVERDWAAEPWTRGCYGAHFPTGAWTRYGPALREPVGPIHWAGTETATPWIGYLDGAVESGERAAAEVLSG